MVDLLVHEKRGEENMFGYQHVGFIGFIIFVLDIFAIIHIVSSSESVGKKLLWTLFVLVLPVIGLIFWFFLGPRQNKRF